MAAITPCCFALGHITFRGVIIFSNVFTVAGGVKARVMTGSVAS